MARTEKVAGDGCSGGGGGGGGEGQVEVEVGVGMGMDGKGMIECRICQEEGDEGAMDSPCACTGTLKVTSPSLSISLPHASCFFSWVFLKNCEDWGTQVSVWWNRSGNPMLFLVVVVFFREMSKCQDFLSLFYPFLMLFPFTIMLLQFLLFALLFSPFFLALSVRYMSTSFFFLLWFLMEFVWEDSCHCPCSSCGQQFISI